MGSYLNALDDAKKSVRVADHMLNVTYSLVNDPKLFFAILQKIYSAQKSTIKAVLNYDVYYRRIPPFDEENFTNMFNIFKVRCTTRYRIRAEHIALIHDVVSIISEHRKSPMVFSRHDRFVICSEDYMTKVLSKEKLNDYLRKTKIFIQEAEYMIAGKR